MLRFTKLPEDKAAVTNAEVEAVAAFLGYIIPRISLLVKAASPEFFVTQETTIRDVLLEGAQLAVDTIESLDPVDKI
jgi:hypothetical protein